MATSRIQKIRRIAKRLGKRALRRGGNRPLVRRVVRSRIRPILAYDLETTRIRSGTPEPLYLTVYSADFQLSARIDSLRHLAEILKTRLLTEEFNRCRFVAWNGNRFDVYLIARALLLLDGFVLRPYLTRNNNLRGLCVIRKAGKRTLKWEFLDGMSMLGLEGRKLDDFLRVFAPNYRKLEGPDFDHEDFNPSNPQHVLYAERDAEGLYRGITHAQQIVLDHFGVPLFPTIGNTAIRILMRNLPVDVQVWSPGFQVVEIIRRYVMRGGYCWCVKRYQGPIWKYDLNQAYAAAMREAWLPAGRCMRISGKAHPYANAAIYRVRARNPRNLVPFYYRDEHGSSVFGFDTISDTWITSDEYRQLLREKWDIEVIEGYFWDSVFNLREYVDKLETLRRSDPDGPNGALGTMVKAIGNNSYGKTVETLDGLELVLAPDCPEGFSQYSTEDELSCVWFRFVEPLQRDYHQPHIGAFITAYVRMVVRQAILLNPEAWLYADTDCVVFSEPVDLNLDPLRYGFWKLEVDGDDYYIIRKKTYAAVDGSKIHAKGLNVKRLTIEDMKRWYDGEPPLQHQVQRQNFLKVMAGFEMFCERSRVGEIV